MSDFQILNDGQLIASHLEVLEFHGENALGASYLVRDISNHKKFLAKQLSFNCDENVANEIRSHIATLRGIEHKCIAGFEDFILEDKTGYLLLEYIEGELLDSHLKMRRERGQILGLKAAYSFLAHLSVGLNVIHQAGYAYGCLSPHMIIVTREGRIRIANFICSFLAENYLSDGLRNRYFDTPFTAPEVRRTRHGANPTSDIYSLSLLFTELLSAVSLDEFGGSAESFIARLPGVSANVKEALIKGAKSDPSERFQSALTFKDTLKTAVDAPSDDDLSSILMGVNDLRALNASGDLPAVDPTHQSVRKPDLFDSGTRTSARAPINTQVWIYQKDGMDYGPFDHEGLIKKFYDEVITESTSVFNTSTKKRQNLGTIPEFQKEVEEYLPLRAKNHEIRMQAEKKKKNTKIAAGTGVAFVIVGVVAAFFIGTIIYFNSLEPPKALAWDVALPVFDKKFELPKTEEFTLNVDESQAKALFDPDASEAEIEAALRAWEAEHRKKFAGKRRPVGAKKGLPGEEIETLVFTGEDGQELEPLLDWEIEEQCMSPRMMRKVQECYRTSAGGRHVSMKVNFTINQNGTLRNLSTTTSGPLNDCIISAFSSLKFRPYGGTAKKVSIPIG